MASLLVLTSCRCFSLQHTLGGDDEAHLWHTLPAKAGFYLVGGVLFVAFLPLVLFEDVGNHGGLAEHNQGVSTYLISGPAIAAAYVLSAPFVVLGLPWEFAAPRSESEAPLEPEQLDNIRRQEFERRFWLGR